MCIGPNRVLALDKVHPEEKISGSGGPRHVTMLNFVQIGPSIVEILQFFFKMATVRQRHLGVVWGIFRPPTESTVQNLVMMMQ